MFIEEKLDRILAILEGAPGTELTPKRGRGRPVKGEDTAPVVVDTPKETAPVPAETPAVDPFESEPAKTVTLTIEDVRTPALALSKATNQENAVKIMKEATGAASFGELKPEQYAAAIAAFQKAIGPATTEDPFGAPAPAGAKQEAVVAPDLATVKKVVVDAQKRTGTDKVQQLVMSHGGVAVNPSTGAKEPSLKALPVSSYAAVLEALGRLPTTK